MEKRYLAVAAAVMMAPSVYAADLIHWTDTSVTVLYGDNYDLAPSEKNWTGTFETAGGWAYGDWFGFFDFSEYDDTDENAGYGEISPRLSLGKMTGNDMSMGPVKDLSLAFTYEFGRGPVEGILYGIGMDLDVPGFSYFNVNTYRRTGLDDNDNDGWQLTPVWRMDIPVGNSYIVFDGFIDWMFATDDDHFDTNFHFNPQLKYDLGTVIGGKYLEKKLYVGIEYDYWKDKYGVPVFDVDQSAYSIIVKYHF